MPTTNHQQYKNLSTVKQLSTSPNSIPSGAFGADIQCVHQLEITGTAVSGVRYTLDGDDPTEDVGMLIAANETIHINGSELLRNMKFIRGSASEDPRLEVTFYTNAFGP